jgi:hypothetical protein
VDSNDDEDSFDYWKESLKSAIRYGVSISEYNEMTPYELTLYADIFEEKREEKLTLLWRAEWLHRTEEPPTLNEFIGKEEETKEMSDEEMLANVMQINAAMGGAFEKVGE